MPVIKETDLTKRNQNIILEALKDYVNQSEKI